MFFSSSKSLSFITSSTSLHTLLTIFTDSKVPFTVAHTVYQSYFILLTVCTQDIQNVHKTLNGLSIIFYHFHSLYCTRDVQNGRKTGMACQSYFIILTVYMWRIKHSQTTTQGGACSGSPQLSMESNWIYKIKKIRQFSNLTIGTVLSPFQIHIKVAI